NKNRGVSQVKVMQAVEFQAHITNGTIEIPAALRARFPDKVNVILFAAGNDEDQSSWPEQNQRRWELIAKKARNSLSDGETDELAVLQRRADEQLAQVGPRPVAELEKLYSELTHKE